MTNSFCQQPVWSPDGTKIAFSTDMSENYDVWVVNLKDLKMERITNYSGLDVKPAWSNDGKQIAFISSRSGIMEIWVKNIDNNNLKKLTPFGNEKIECKDVVW